MVKLIADQQATIEQRQSLIRFALRPVRCAQRDVDPRLGVVVGRSRPATERFGGFVERCTITGEFS